MSETPITALRPPRPPELAWLTILRYPAAVWVVAVHSLNQINELRKGPVLPPSLLNTAIDRGFLGVSFFFMLSGFILAWNYPTIENWRRYAVARAARILPVYYLSLLVSLPLFLAGWATYGGFAAVVVKAVAVLTLLQSWWPSIAGVWNVPAWTLSCEAFFYLCLPFLLPILSRSLPFSRPRRALGLLMAIWVAGLVLPAVFDRVFHCPNLSADFSLNKAWGSEVKSKLFIEKFPPLRLLEFVAGAALCIWIRPLLLAARSGKSDRLAYGLILGGGLWIATSGLVPFIYSLGTWCLPGFASVIAGFALLPVRNEHSAPLQFGKLLGGASYSLYLLHMSAVKYVGHAYGHYLDTAGQLPGQASFWMFFALILTTMTAISVAVFQLYEEPMRRLGVRLGKLPFFVGRPSAVVLPIKAEAAES